MVVYLITSIGLFFSLTNILPKPFNKKQTFLGMILLLSCLMLFHSRTGQVSTYILLIFFTIYLSLVFKKHLVVNVSCSLLGYICYVLSDSLVSQILMRVFNLSLEEIFSTYYILTVFLICITSFYITMLIGILFRKKLKIRDLHFSKPVSLLLLSNIIFTVIMLIFNFINGEQAGYTKENLTFNTILITVYSIITFCIFIILMKNIQKEEHMNALLQQYESLQHYTEELERTNLDMRAFKHDYINILSSLTGYIEENDMVGLRNVFENKITPISNDFLKSSTRLSFLSHIKIPELKSLFSSKIIYAENQGVHVFIDIVDDVTSFPMDIIDLVRVLGIFLTNATEELLNLEQKDKLCLNLGIVKKSGSTLILIQNTTAASSEMLASIYEAGYSTKGKGRGLGLYTARNIIGNYPNIVHSTSIQDGMFIQSLEFFD